MRITYRSKHIRDYWENRWASVPPDQPMENLDAYPLKYAELTIQSQDGKILEAGCGAGRILRYYKNKGYKIVGVDFIKDAIKKLKEIDSELDVEVGDITNLNFENQSFRYVLAFGLYHNLEKGLNQAVHETYRVLEPGGKLCASFRADNIQTLLTDWLAGYRTRKRQACAPVKFHKLNFIRSEFVELFEEAGFKIENVYPVENMPILYKSSLFRSKEHVAFCESRARKEGYQLSPIGNLIQKKLMHYLPEKFCNIYVLIAQKPQG